MTNRRCIALVFLIVVGCAVAMLPLHVAAQKTDHAKELGAKLMCMCGCGQILTQCNHLNCPSSGPMLKELDQRVASGEADDLIIQDYIQEYGEKVLSSPPATGFNSIAWYIPGFALALGLVIVVAVIRLWRKREYGKVGVPAEVSSRDTTPATELFEDRLRKAREQADRETED